MNKSILSIGLALAAFAFTTIQGHAQLIFQFEQQGANTVVTGSGSGTTNPAGLDANHVGYLFGGGANNQLFNRNAVTPAGWIVDPVGVNVNQIVGGSTLTLGGGEVLNRLFYGSNTVTERLYFIDSNFSNIPASTLVTASGSSTFTNPGFLNLFTNYAPGTVLQIFPNVLHFIIGFAPPVVVTPVGGGGGHSKPQSY